MNYFICKQDHMLPTVIFFHVFQNFFGDFNFGHF